MCRNSFKMAVLDFQDAAQLENSAQLEKLSELGRVHPLAWRRAAGHQRSCPGQSRSRRLPGLWARELGSWSYLPGGLPQSDLSDLCEQAFQVVERLHHPSRS